MGFGLRIRSDNGQRERERERGFGGERSPMLCAGVKIFGLGFERCCCCCWRERESDFLSLYKLFSIENVRESGRENFFHFQG